MEIEKVGEYGAPIFINLGYNGNLLQAMRDVLKNDRDILESKIVQGDRIIDTHCYGTLTDDLKGTWDVCCNEKLWGRITFVPLMRHFYSN